MSQFVNSFSLEYKVTIHQKILEFLKRNEYVLKYQSISNFLTNLQYSGDKSLDYVLHRRNMDQSRYVRSCKRIFVSTVNFKYIEYVHITQ